MRVKMMRMRIWGMTSMACWSRDGLDLSKEHIVASLCFVTFTDHPGFKDHLSQSDVRTPGG